MREGDYLEIKGKIVAGVLALTSRTLLLQIISFASTLILTILLSPAVFGIFFVVSALMSFLGYFSDIGLAAALIQKKDEPTGVELSTVFTIQQLIVGGLVLLGFMLVPFINGFYNLGIEGEFLLRAFLMAFFLSSLKTIPSVMLERKLQFNLLIIPQILETTTFYIIAIAVAARGGGVNSFAWAALGRGLIGLIAIYIMCPWRISFSLSIQAAKELMSFGFPFQINSVLALIKDDLMTIFLGKILPFQLVGYIGWAKKWAEVSLRLIMDSVIRVTFPAFSRLQENKEILRKAIEKSMFFLALFIFPVTVFLFTLIKPMIIYIPKYQKWEPALLSFYLFSFSSVIAAFSSTLVNALNAIGKVKYTLYLMIGWTILTWILIPSLIGYFSFNGVAAASVLISLTSIFPVIIMKRFVKFNILPQIIRPFILSIITFLLIRVLIHTIQGLIGIIVSVAIAAIFYSLAVFFTFRVEINPYLPKFLKIK